MGIARVVSGKRTKRGGVMLKHFKKENGFEIWFEDESNCCGKPFEEETDICSECGEHAGIRCSECYGLGEVEVMIKESFASQRIDPRYEKQQCEKCHGRGEI